MPHWTRESLHDTLLAQAEPLGMKTGQMLWPLRIAASGQEVTPGGAIEVLYLVGRAESLRRLESGRQRLLQA